MRATKSATLVVAAALLIGSAVTVGSAPASATPVTRHVATTGADTGDCTNAAAPCLTINYAVTQAAAGDIVSVAAGHYPEQVVVDRSLVFRGANAGLHSGVASQPRGPETVVKGFRSPGDPYPTPDYEFSATIDGFTISPQRDAAIIAGGDIPNHLVSLFGGPRVVVKNNVFRGGPFVSDCSYTCTTMADFALFVQSGTFTIKNNTFLNFRRPVDISQNTAAFPIVAGTVSGNLFRHITSRGIWLREGDCFGPDACGGDPVDTTAGIHVTGNTFDGTGALSPVTGGPAALVITTAGNIVDGNTFRGNDPGVFDQVCDPSNHPTAAPNKFRRNTFEGNVDGIMYFAVDTGQCPAEVHARIARNSFVGNTGFGVRWYPVDTAPNDLDARCNWWGAAAGPGTTGADRVTSGVLTTPWKVDPGYFTGVCSGH